jgi:hypothetical protein
MLARVYSCAVIGLDGMVVEVEGYYTSGFPDMTIVGLPNAARPPCAGFADLPGQFFDWWRQ